MANTGAGLLTHMTRMHAGRELTPYHVQQLNFFNKGVCESCGSFRARQRATCTWCRRTTRCREPIAGDIVQGHDTERAPSPIRSSQQQQHDNERQHSRAHETAGRGAGQQSTQGYQEDANMYEAAGLGLSLIHISEPTRPY